MSVEMKERPILMTPESVKAILDGRKTMTRRVVKGIALDWLAPNMFTPEFVADPDNSLCHYGQVGDRLWVRETHYKYGGWVLNGFTKTGRPHWEFQPMSEEVRYYDNPPEILCKNRRGLGWWKRPSMYLFKVDARITLEITEIRVERLQEISNADILAEGIISSVESDAELRLRFRNLWDSLNAKRGYGWEKNPWVWVIKFDNIGIKVK